MLLASQSTIRYTRFYDGTEKTATQLVNALGFDKFDRSSHCAEHVVNVTAFDLSELGLMETKQFDESLPDVERDFEIVLTAKGRKQRRLKSKIAFWDEV